MWGWGAREKKIKSKRRPRCGKGTRRNESEVADAGMERAGKTSKASAAQDAGKDAGE